MLAVCDVSEAVGIRVQTTGTTGQTAPRGSVLAPGSG
jgi:hypothetical protein